MVKSPTKFHFPTDIALKSSPLVEAWLEIRWQLQSGDPPGLVHDPAFPFALGRFYASIHDRFGFIEDLDASNAPLNMLPYVVRHRFRPHADDWPLLQLGPGIATVNFTHPYTWQDFKDVALYLRGKLLDAYDQELRVKTTILRYRNAIPYKYTSNNLLAFLSGNLNTSVELPRHIPGKLGRTGVPRSASIKMTFELAEPAGNGTLALVTGTKKEIVESEELEIEHVILDLDVSSGDEYAPTLNDQSQFDQWLTSAHAVLHEWFFSFIEGPLFEQYQISEGI